MRSKPLTEILAEEFPEEDEIIGRGVLPRGCKMVLYGQYKSKKSMFVGKMAVCIANGAPWLGFPTIRGGESVLYLQLEIPRKQLQERLWKISRFVQGRTKEELFIWTESFLKLDDNSGFELMRQELMETGSRVLIIDPLYKIMKGDILAASAMMLLLDTVDRLIAEFGVTVVLVSHTRKGIYEEKNSDDLLGSVTLSAWADSVVKVERKEDKTLRVKFEVMRHAREDIETVVVQDEEELLLEPIAPMLKLVKGI